jgi:hypothetical protein
MTEQRPSYEMVVERGKVREFARATKSSNPEYLDDPTPPIPPTFLTTAGFWAPMRGRPQAAGGGGPGSQAAAAGGARNMSRVLHGGQEYIFYGPPPRAGAKLSVSSRALDTYEREGRRGGKMTFTVTATEFRDETGRLVAEGRSTGIVTSRPPTQES